MIFLNELKFHSLDIEHKQDYIKVYNECPERAADFSFINLYAWAVERNFEIAFSHGLFWIRASEESRSSLWSPVGPWFSVDWGSALAGLFPEGTVIERVPEKLALHLKETLGEKILITEQVDQWEYVYNVEELVQLKGNRFHKKKNKLRQFENNYKYEFIDINHVTIERILLMQEEWCKWKNCDGSPGLKAEHDSIVRILGAWDNFPDILGGAIFIDDYMAAYTIAEAVSKDTLIIHFEKGMTEYQGIYQAINQKFLEYKGEHFTWVNREQDMGKEGLRKAKSSYNPDHFVKKYSVQWKP